MKHIPIEYFAINDDDNIVFKCLNCDSLLCDFHKMAFYETNLLWVRYNDHNGNYLYSALNSIFGPIISLDADNCDLTCNEALIKGILE